MDTTGLATLVAVSLAALAVTIFLVVRGKLRWQYAAVSLLVGGALVFLATWTAWIGSTPPGFFHSPSAMLVLCAASVFALMVHILVVVTRLKEENRKLTSRLASAGRCEPEPEYGVFDPGEECVRPPGIKPPLAWISLEPVTGLDPRD